MNIHKAAIVFFAIIVIGILLASCKKTSTTGFSPDVTSYPLKSGNTWTYTRTFWTHNFRPIVPGTTFSYDSINTTTRVEVLGQRVLLDSILTWEVKSTETGGPSTAIGTRYYRIILDSLFVFAYTGSPSLIIPKPNPRSSITFTYAGRTYRSMLELVSALQQDFLSIHQTLDTLYEQRPPKTFVFPLRVESEWLYRQQGYPFRIGHKVIQYTVSQFPIGSRPVYKIQWFWDLNDDGMWDENIEGYDYVSYQGVLKRVFYIRDILVTLSDPDPIGYVDATDEYVIQTLSLN